MWKKITSVFVDSIPVLFQRDFWDTMLNRRYIEDLLNRIRKLEEDPEHIDRNELLRLNAELDAILEKIRRL